MIKEKEKASNSPHHPPPAPGLKGSVGCVGGADSGAGGDGRAIDDKHQLRYSILDRPPLLTALLLGFQVRARTRCH